MIQSFVQRYLLGDEWTLYTRKEFVVGNHLVADDFVF